MAGTDPKDLERALSERVVVVLVQPQYAGNVGATARAMKNMGLRRLVLVDPPAYDAEQARWMAPGCDDLLAGIRIVSRLEEALDGAHRVIATTARHRRRGQLVYEPRQAAAVALDDAEGTTAILFGREDYGLDKAAIDISHSVLRIPTLEHASLNLGQAVLVVANALFEEARSRGLAATGRTLGGSRSRRSTRSAARGSSRDRRADLSAITPAAEDLIGLLERVGYTRGTRPEKIRGTAMAALQSADLRVREVEALRGMVRRVQWALNHPGEDWSLSAKENRRED
ncbi:MAG: TrmH family RNA methyltransferase [Myxococcota bacterium]